MLIYLFVPEPLVGLIPGNVAAFTIGGAQGGLEEPRSVTPSTRSRPASCWPPGRWCWAWPAPSSRSGATWSGRRGLGHSSSWTIPAPPSSLPAHDSFQSAACRLGCLTGRSGRRRHRRPQPPNCPGTFQVLHNDRIGGMQLPKGPYVVTVLDSASMGCTEASRLFTEFLEDWTASCRAPG